MEKHLEQDWKVTTVIDINFEATVIQMIKNQLKMLTINKDDPNDKQMRDNNEADANCDTEKAKRNTL
jgi:hypothetical protein